MLRRPQKKAQGFSPTTYALSLRHWHREAVPATSRSMAASSDSKLFRTLEGLSQYTTTHRNIGGFTGWVSSLLAIFESFSPYLISVWSPGITKLLRSYLTNIITLMKWVSRCRAGATFPAPVGPQQSKWNMHGCSVWSTMNERNESRARSKYNTGAYVMMVDAIINETAESMQGRSCRHPTMQYSKYKSPG